MANTPDYSWPPMNKRKVMGQRLKRADGPAKASGRAKYGSDMHPGACCLRPTRSAPTRTPA